MEYYHPTEVLADGVIAIGRSTTASAQRERYAYIKGSKAQVGWAPVQLLTMRPPNLGSVALEEVTGRQQLSNRTGGSLHTWPYVVMEPDPVGIRGRIKDLEYGSENYAYNGPDGALDSKGTGAVPTGSTMWKDGATWMAFAPWAEGGATDVARTSAASMAHSPLGAPIYAAPLQGGTILNTAPNNCGPIVVTKVRD
jgi:hypothetical protein